MFIQAFIKGVKENKMHLANQARNFLVFLKVLIWAHSKDL